MSPTSVREILQEDYWLVHPDIGKALDQIKSLLVEKVEELRYSNIHKSAELMKCYNFDLDDIIKLIEELCK